MTESPSLLSRFRDRDHTQGSLLVSIAVLSIPSVLMSVAGFGLFQLVDLYILGQLGPGAIAAAGATNQVVRQLIFLLLMGLTFSAQMMISRLVGMGNLDAAEHVAGQTILLGLVVAAGSAIVGFFSHELVSLLKRQKKRVHEANHAEYKYVLSKTRSKELLLIAE